MYMPKEKEIPKSQKLYRKQTKLCRNKLQATGITQLASISPVAGIVGLSTDEFRE